MKKKFTNAARAKDAAVAAYFSSEEFLDEMRRAVKLAIVDRDYSRAYVDTAGIKARPQDMPYIEAAFAKLKEEYPQLNHVRVNKGVGAALGFMIVSMGTGEIYQGEIVLDTKKNSLHRRFSGGFSKDPHPGTRFEKFGPFKP
jgi:hypothetical protein